MNKHIYICPATHSELNLVVENETYYINAKKDKYAFKEGYPDFTYPLALSAKQQEQHQYYENNAAIYDDVQNLTFAIQNENEDIVRKEMVSYLNLKPNAKVLELSCGTGLDSVNIASLLNNTGELYVQDISLAMLKQCKNKLDKFSVPVHYSVGNASYLAFPDNYFDAVFSFGGLNVYDDMKRSLREMVRVTKPGGRIVVGDESLPAWLYDTDFGKVMLNANPLLKFPVPFENIPVEARNVTVKWIIGGVYYLISFTVGEGEPKGNFNIEIPGRRGGTLKTRYYGQLEGVSEETKQRVLAAAAKNNVSVHKWLEQVLTSALSADVE